MDMRKERWYVGCDQSPSECRPATINSLVPPYILSPLAAGCEGASGSASSAQASGWSDAPLSRRPASNTRRPRRKIQSILGGAAGPNFFPTASTTSGTAKSRPLRLADFAVKVA